MASFKYRVALLTKIGYDMEETNPISLTQEVIYVSDKNNSTVIVANATQ